MKTIAITFTVVELQAVVDGLAELPAKRSMELIRRIVAEYEASNNKANPVDKTSDK